MSDRIEEKKELPLKFFGVKDKSVLLSSGDSRGNSKPTPGPGRSGPVSEVATTDPVGLVDRARDVIGSGIELSA
jgi:hypothetical protein